jgi:tetratricopeptide (TPR) repeat protein
VIKLAAQFVPVKQNAEKEGKELAKKHGVRGFPTILFLDEKEEVVGRIGGYMPPGPFADEMTKFAEVPKVEAAYKARPDDPETSAKMATVFAMRGKLADAEAALAKAEKGKYDGPAVAKAYNAIGDFHQLADKFDDAIRYFKKADAAAKNVSDRAYAKISIMYCYLGKEDRDAAKAVAKEIVEMKDAPKEFLEMAQQILK